MIKILIVGISRRIIQYYEPIFKQLEKEKKAFIVGIYNRTYSKAKKLNSKFSKAIVYEDLESAINSKNYDLAIISIPYPLRFEIAKQCLYNKKHIFLEAPATFTSKENLILKRIADKNKSYIEIAEDFANFPEAIIQRKIVESKILGEIETIFNDESGFRHHGLARVSSLFPENLEVQKIKINKTKLNKNQLNQTQITFSNKVNYIERFYNNKNHLSRKLNEWKIVLTSGIITNNSIYFLEKDKEKIINLPNFRIEDKINSFKIKIKNKEFEFITPDKSWNKKKTSLYYLISNQIKAINKKNKKYLSYGIKRSYVDTKIANMIDINKKIKIFKNSKILSMLEDSLNIYTKIKK